MREQILDNISCFALQLVTDLRLHFKELVLFVAKNIVSEPAAEQFDALVGEITLP